MSETSCRLSGHRWRSYHSSPSLSASDPVLAHHSLLPFIPSSDPQHSFPIPSLIPSTVACSPSVLRLHQQRLQSISITSSFRGGEERSLPVGHLFLLLSTLLPASLCLNHLTPASCLSEGRALQISRSGAESEKIVLLLLLPCLCLRCLLLLVLRLSFLSLPLTLLSLAAYSGCFLHPLDVLLYSSRSPPPSLHPSPSFSSTPLSISLPLVFRDE